MYNREESWLDLVLYTKIEDYIKSKFPDAEDIQIRINDDRSYLVSFCKGADIYKGLEFVTLTPYMTSIEGNEFDVDWVSLVRNCNKGRKIEGWSYDEDLVVSLDKIIYSKKIEAFKKANKEYKEDVEKVNALFTDLGIEEEIEPRQF